jgi:hypothetical protein
MAEEPEIAGATRNDKGQFLPGVNPAGKPTGSVSIAKIEKKFEESPQYFDEWVDELLKDGHNRKAVMEQTPSRFSISPKARSTSHPCHGH